MDVILNGEGATGYRNEEENRNFSGVVMIYCKYLRYVLRHRWFVMVECFKVSLYWRGISHDLSKFRPSEFIPYARFFYGSSKPKRDTTGYYKPTDTGDNKFDFAWLLHQKVNDHHWQWWILPEDEGGIKILPMTDDAVIEMVCDWVGAGKAQGYLSPKEAPMQECQRWYEKNKAKMQLHPSTRKTVEYILSVPEWQRKYFINGDL
jgi:hypothetical protein